MLFRRPCVAALSLPLALCAAAALTASAFAQQPAPHARPGTGPVTKLSVPVPILPTDFAGWRLASPLMQSTSPAAADAVNADVLTEDGFTRFAAGTYTRDGDKLLLHAIRFEDATGAFAAYTFFRRPGMGHEDIGMGGAFDGSHVLFWKGATLVDATFDHLTGMSAAELRELADAMARPSGPSAVPPPLPGYLPTESGHLRLEEYTGRYALGPAGYTRGGGVLPASLVDFNRGAEVLTVHYTGRDGDGTLTLIDYPTPQLAGNRQRAIDDYLKAGNTPQAAWPQALASASPASLVARRSGPLVIVTAGAFNNDVAHVLAERINYVATVTWNNPAGYVSEASKTARLLLGIFTLTAILGGGAILLGLFLGGGRALYRKLRGRPVSSLEEAEFISLHLSAGEKVEPNSVQNQS